MAKKKRSITAPCQQLFSAAASAVHHSSTHSMASKTAKKLKRLAASLVFLREKNSAVPGDQFEVFVGTAVTNHEVRHFNLGFPGGVYDRADGNGVLDGLSFSTDVGILRKICLREAFEETGFLPLSAETANSAVRDKQSWKTWRERVYEDASKWEDFKLETFGDQQDIFQQGGPNLLLFDTSRSRSRNLK